MADFPTPIESRDSILRVIRNGLIKAGVEDPDVRPGSDFFIEATAYSNELSIAFSASQTSLDDLMPDTTTDEAVIRRWATMLGTPWRDAGGSTGAFVLDATQAVTLTAGDELVDDQGLRYDVLVSGTYDPDPTGATNVVRVFAVDAGADTNLEEDAVLRWSLTPGFCAEAQLVAHPGMANGTDGDDIETVRTRVLDRLATPARSGNVAHAIQLAEDSDGRVHKAFGYATYRGPGTMAVCALARPTKHNKSRELDSSIVDNIVGPTVTGGLADCARVDTTAGEDVEVDVSLGLTLPESPLASVPGPGGGWTDAVPWPVVDDDTVFFGEISNVVSSTAFDVTAVADKPPTASVTRVCCVRRTGDDAWTVDHATVVTQVESTPGVYTITLDQPFVGVAAGDYVCPDAERVDDYVEAVVGTSGAFARMGPGQKRSPLVYREYRKPLVSQSWPSDLGGSFLKQVETAGDEVHDVSYLYRSATSPGVPATISGAPKVFVPRRLGFYRLPDTT